MNEGPMVKARKLVEDHIAAYGYVPHPDKLKEEIAIAIGFAGLSSIPHRDDVAAREQEIRADERRRVADAMEKVAANPETDPAKAATLRDLASVLRTDRDKLIIAGLMAMADEIVAEAKAEGRA